MELISEEDVNIIVRQTNYTKEQAEKKLTEHKNNKINVIKEYLDVNNKNKKKISVNQQRIKDFRTLLKDTKPLKTNV